MAEKFKDKDAFFRAFGVGNGVHHFVFSDIHGESTTSIDGRHLAASMWDRLIKAGLAEEERAPGWYWCRENDYWRWSVVGFEGDGKWLYPGMAKPRGTAPAIIGPRIEPPKD